MYFLILWHVPVRCKSIYERVLIRQMSHYHRSLSCNPTSYLQTNLCTTYRCLPLFLERSVSSELLKLFDIVNNTPEGQRLLQEKKRRLEEEAGGAPREDSRVASLAEKVDEDLVVAEASSVGGEENT